jgi:hypothetical protein
MANITTKHKEGANEIALGMLLFSLLGIKN